MLPPSSRALVSNSRVTGRGLPSEASANTQVVLIAIFGQCSLENLELFEESDDVLMSFALIDHDLAGLACLGLLDIGELLVRTGFADLAGIEAEIGDRQLVDRL